MKYSANGLIVGRNNNKRHLANVGDNNKQETRHNTHSLGFIRN